ncbi:MAG TPA: hypothetical protein VFV75_10310 [Candidatus Polarisedimenticolaceae bacterium]|nr:hypothetical protein [Candidatus Polarisedimenticolaceae bacterium]
MKPFLTSVCCLFSLTFAAAPPRAPQPAPVDEALLAGLKARAIGPAIMGGRVSDVALDPADPFTFYVGLATGGVMKTADDGATFSPVFDGQPFHSIGAVAVAPSDPKVIWVGTGEANDRNSSGWGGGVWRSVDGGGTWKQAGLPDSRAIARIVVHPTRPDVAWVAAVGHLWARGGQRGLYKTEDGGTTWTRVLGAEGAAAEDAGCGDVALDPKDPGVVYAALYARRRTPWSFASGPPASGGKDAGGIFKSVDGGRSWKKLSGGLPSGTGRIGLAVHAARPSTVYAVVQAEGEGRSDTWEIRSRVGGVFRSDDGGATWTRTSSLNPRPFYFSQIRVHPTEANRVWLLGYTLHVSDDGGKTWREDLAGKLHPDLHALAVDPRNPRRLLLGTDGGVYQSKDDGKGWAHVNGMAAGQFYRVALDDSDPFRICGGLQDNTSWVGPSRTFTKDGIVHADWIQLGGGDGFSCAFDGENPDLVYAESQEGTLFRMNLRTGDSRPLRPSPLEGEEPYRFHWNAPLLRSLHARGTMYLGGNRVYRLTKQGESVVPISPDLSTGDPARVWRTGSGAETYGVVFALAESPVTAGLLWAGTDDGKLWRTRDDGATWSDLTGSLPREARGHWIERLAASPRQADTAYLAVTAYREGDDRPLLWRTRDGGRTWMSLAAGLPQNGPARAVLEDPFRPGLLYVGTEFGLFVSLDDGASWAAFGGLPPVPVFDVVLHPRTRDLVIATHGRSLFVLDDLTLLEELDAAAREAPVFLATPRPAFGRYLLPGWSEWNGNAVFRGENPPEGVLFTAWVGAFTGDALKLAISGPAPSERPVATLNLPGTPGINRVAWDLKPGKDQSVEYGGQGSRLVAPGTYKVTLTRGEAKLERTFQVTVAPGIETR